ncbi:hypothetical protein ACIQTN_33880 [Streptomyces werraensis]|uniref:hypothetical protein n=1 Tax=Streptomyces werraensis TaxID=68284 RepID=UPI00380474E6
MTQTSAGPARRKTAALLFGLVAAAVTAGEWLVVGPVLYEALRDLPSVGTAQAACIAVVLCVAPVAPLGLLVGVRDWLTVVRGGRREAAGGLWLALAHLVVLGGAALVLAQPHGVPLAVLLAGLLVVPEALTVGVLRLTWPAAD